MSPFGPFSDSAERPLHVSCRGRSGQLGRHGAPARALPASRHRETPIARQTSGAMRTVVRTSGLIALKGRRNFASSNAPCGRPGRHPKGVHKGRPTKWATAEISCFALRRVESSALEPFGRKDLDPEAAEAHIVPLAAGEQADDRSQR